MDKKDGSLENNELLHSLLEEARKISSFVDFQKKLMKWALIIPLIMLPIVFGVTLIMDHSFQKERSEPPSGWIVDWWNVEVVLRRAQPKEALKMALSLLNDMPDYYEGHLTVAQIYLVQGNLKQAEQHFKRAYDLFPIEEHKQFLEAIQQRIELEERQ